MWGNFQNGGSLHFSILASTSSLLTGPYTTEQLALFRKVFALREFQQFTFARIASELSAQGFLSPRDHRLGAENIFSIYKKGKRRMQRLLTPANWSITELVLNRQLADV